MWGNLSFGKPRVCELEAMANGLFNLSSLQLVTFHSYLSSPEGKCLTIIHPCSSTMWLWINTLFLCELLGYRVLVHTHVLKHLPTCQMSYPSPKSMYRFSSAACQEEVKETYVSPTGLDVISDKWAFPNGVWSNKKSEVKPPTRQHHWVFAHSVPMISLFYMGLS